MKNILIIATSYFPINGGQETGLKSIIDEIQKDTSIKLTVLTQKYHKSFPDMEVLDGVTVYRYKSYGIPLLWRFLPKSRNHWSHILCGFLFIKKYFKLLKPDYVLVYFLLPSALPSIIYANKLKIPNVVFLGGSDVNDNRLGLGSAIQYALKHTDKIIVTSKDIEDIVTTSYDIDKSKITKIPYGIELNKEKIIRTNDKINIACVQRLVPIKSTITLIEAIKIIVDKGITNFFVDIVGDGELRKSLEELVVSLDVGSYVKFHGNIDHQYVGEYYKRADIFCFPTLSEGFGVVLLEAMMYGNIIVASNAPDIPEIIKDGYNGMLFNAGDAQDLAKKLIPIINNKKTYEYLVENGYQEVEKYSIDRIVKRILEVLFIA